jgi:hypothetical protein
MRSLENKYCNLKSETISFFYKSNFGKKLHKTSFSPKVISEYSDGNPNTT